jgi:GT2 family glycosyltransferase
MNRQQIRTLPFVILLLPLDVLVAACLALTCAVMALRQGPKPDGSGASYLSPVRRTPATIQILNWDGKSLLAECLPAVLEAVRVDGGQHQVLVVDNGSTDGSARFVRENFPQVRVLELDRNYGFVGGNNRGVETVETDIVIFLNNDMIVDRGFLKPLLDGFIDDAVFAVTSQIYFEDKTAHRAETGKTRAKFEKGFLRVWHAPIDPVDELKNTMPVFWAGGGSCAFDRAKYRLIGGLDELYKPFYVEDADISYQAWKRGWKCLLAPSSRVVHKHRATSSREFSHDFIDNTIRRNLYLFIWKNITDGSLILEHIRRLPTIHSAAAMTLGGAFEVRAYVRSVLRLPAALIRRWHHQSSTRVSDGDVFARSQQ